MLLSRQLGDGDYHNLLAALCNKNYNVYPPRHVSLHKATAVLAKLTLCPPNHATHCSREPSEEGHLVAALPVLKQKARL